MQTEKQKRDAEKSRRWRERNPEKARASVRAYRDKNRERLRASNRQHRKVWRENNLEESRMRNRTWAKNHPEQNRIRSRKWRALNITTARKRAREWAHRNLDVSRAYKRKRAKADPVFNITAKIRHRIRSAIKAANLGGRKQERTIALLGCSFLELKFHIEKQFTLGMTWSAVMAGEIHLDHIRPCASFNLTSLAQQKICFHYTNLQPLWAKDNMVKGDKYVREVA